MVGCERDTKQLLEDIMNQNRYLESSIELVKNNNRICRNISQPEFFS